MHSFIFKSSISAVNKVAARCFQNLLTLDPKHLAGATQRGRKFIEAGTGAGCEPLVWCVYPRPVVLSDGRMED